MQDSDWKILKRHGVTPDSLSVGGYLDLRGTAITALPDSLSVGGCLDLEGAAITALPDSLSVGGCLDLEGTAITALPDNLSVGGSLYLRGTAITALPDNLSVGGSLYLRGTAITALLGTAERTLFEMLLGTGQRISDALKARWSDVHDGGIDVTQNKTKTKLWVPWTEDLAAAIDATPRMSVFICPNPHSRGQWTYFRASDTMRDARRAVGAMTWDLHSLRYTATAELARAGCTDEEIQAITGHKSVAMIRKYAGPARQIARANQARERTRGEQ